MGRSKGGRREQRFVEGLLGLMGGILGILFLIPLPFPLLFQFLSKYGVEEQEGLIAPDEPLDYTRESAEVLSLFSWFWGLLWGKVFCFFVVSCGCGVVGRVVGY